jgi:hypothetical protein
MTDGAATAALARIREKLRRLRTIDTAFTRFGALTHRYRLGPPLTEPELQSHERRLGVSIPTEYRRFLTEIGHGGAGPFYGLFTLDGDCPSALSGELSKPFGWTEAFNPEADTESEDADDFANQALAWRALPLRVRLRSLFLLGGRR